MELLDLLKSVKPGVDFTEGELITGGVLDSFDVLQIISAISEEYDIKVGPRDVIPENFDSVEAMEGMIERLSEE